MYNVVHILATLSVQESVKLLKAALEQNVLLKLCFYHSIVFCSVRKLSMQFRVFTAGCFPEMPQTHHPTLLTLRAMHSGANCRILMLCNNPELLPGFEWKGGRVCVGRGVFGWADMCECVGGSMHLI